MFTFIFALTITHAATLDEAFRSALEKSEIAAQAKEQTVQAKERYDQAKAGPMPTLKFHVDHMIQPRLDDPLAREFFPEKQRTTNFQLIQPIFSGFKEFAGLGRFRDLLDAQRQLEIQELSDLYDRVAAAYLEVLAREQDMRNLTEQLEIYGQRVKDLGARSRRGESARNETLTAQSNRAALEAEVQIVESQLRSARQTLAYLTGLPAEEKLADIDQKMPALLKLDEYLAGIERRPDVLAAKAQAESAKEDVRIARSQHWPTIDAVGNYYLERPGLLGEVDWDVRFRLTMPIFEGGLRMNQTQEMSSKKREADLELSRVRREALSTIRSLHASLELRATQLEALSRSMDLARRSYQALQRDFRRGLTRNVDVALALTDYRIARRGFDQARYLARLDQIRLDLASARFPESLKRSGP